MTRFLLSSKLTTVLLLLDDSGVSYSWAMFTFDVDLPAMAPAASADLIVTLDSTAAVGVDDGRVVAESVVDAAAFDGGSPDSDIGDRSWLSSPAASFDVVGPYVAGTEKAINVTFVLSDRLAQGGWLSGNRIALRLDLPGGGLSGITVSPAATLEICAHGGCLGSGCLSSEKKANGDIVLDEGRLGRIAPPVCFCFVIRFFSIYVEVDPPFADPCSCLSRSSSSGRGWPSICLGMLL